MHDADKQYLADHYYDYLTIALKLLNDEDEARDAVQEAMASTMAMPWVKDVHRYCCKVLRNYCWDRLKEEYIVAAPPTTLAAEEPDLQYERRIELLTELKAQLPAATAALLDMHYREGMTLREMALRLGRPEMWVKKKIMKALRQLKEEIIYEESKE